MDSWPPRPFERATASDVRGRPPGRMSMTCQSGDGPARKPRSSAGSTPANTTDEFSANKCELRVGRYPIESVSAFHLKTDETEGWVTETDVEYLIRRACIVSLFFPLGVCSQLVRVTYTGGYVLPGTTPGSGQTALPDDLEQACVEQVAFWYQRRHQLGLITVPSDGRTFYQLGQIDLLPNVLPILKKYQRYVV